MTSNSLVLFGSVNRRLNDFRDHLNELFSTPDTPYVPLHMVAPAPDSDTSAHDKPQGEEGEEEPVPWWLSTRQFRRTLAWHIAHQPFGVVAGARQYQHAELALFEGYAGTSASGFAAEVATERAIAQLDYVEDLYRDWNDGHRTSGGAAGRVNAEFDRIRRELGDLPGIIASPTRLRTMLQHLTKTLHPGVLNDCFYQPSTALCAKRAQHTGRPLPLLTMCLTCPNGRRSSVHLPRLTTARAQAQRPLDAPAGLSRLQTAALTTHIAELDHAIAELRTPPKPRRMNDPSALRLRHALEHASVPVRPGVDQAIVHAFERIMSGSPERTNGGLTVTALCIEAGISRATYYRSPLAKTLTGLLQAPDTPRSQDDTLTAEITRLKRADRALRSQHAAEQREMRATIAAYANRIQALSLRNAELEAESAALREHLGQAGGSLTSLR
ncbi:hypothetical protein ACFV1X_37315 [Streptomyces coelicoflavus]|uniref:hypothetical protein n=1 Tax=Streptomyces coelicoflavus TaxID=285562 RepID=UPI0036BECCFF